MVIVVLALHYNEAQQASSAADFREVVGDQRGRFVAAGVVDVLFALTYAALALAVRGRIGAAGTTARRLATAGAASLVVGALFDIAENTLLVRNVDRWAELSDADVARMVDAGTGKWAFALLGCALALAAWLLARRGQPAKASS